MDLMKTMTSNQEKLQLEQARLRVAMGESGLIVLTNAETLRNVGAAVVRLWHEAGLPIADAPEVPPEAVN
jgi:hypothetical protein